MSGIAIIGSAIASALLGKVFSKIIDAKEPEATDKKSFQQELNQSAANAKADGVCKATSASDSAGVGRDNVKPEPAASLPSLSNMLGGLLGQARISKPTGESAGLSKQDLTYMVGYIGESDFQRANLMQSMVENFASIDADGNGKISDSESKVYKTMGVTSGPPSIGSSANYEAGAPRDGNANLDDLLASLEAKEAANDVSVASILQKAARLKASYGVDAAKTASSQPISTSA